MKSTFRIGLLLALIALVAFVPAFSASAQGGTCVPGLAAEDCQLIADASANTSGFTAFKMESWSVAIKTQGITGGDIDLNVSGDGAVDTTGVSVTAGDTSSVLQNLKFLLTMTASLSAPNYTGPANGQLEVRIVDGYLYFKGDPLTQNQWQKLELEGALESSGMGSLLDPSMLSGQAQGALANPALLGAASGLVNAPGLANGEAVDGPTIGGEPTRQITTNVSLEVLLKTLTSEEFRPALRQILAASGQGTVSDADLAQLAQFVTFFEPTLKATKLSIVQYIGKNDKALHGVGLNFSTTLDASNAALLGGAGAISLDFSFDVKVSELGQSITVEPVADATEVRPN